VKCGNFDVHTLTTEEIMVPCHSSGSGSWSIIINVFSPHSGPYNSGKNKQWDPDRSGSVAALRTTKLRASRKIFHTQVFSHVKKLRKYKAS
jgi:hypothetical protein